MNKKHIVNQILQWSGTTCIIIMQAIMSLYPELHPLNIFFSLFGTLLFLTWSIRVKNLPQAVVNAFSALVCFAGLVKYLL